MTAGVRRPWLTRAEAAGRWLENALLVTLFVGLAALAVTQIALRNFFSLGLPWADGLIRLAVLWIAVLGAVAAGRDGKHIAIDLTQRFLPAAWHARTATLTEAFTAAVCGLLTFHSWIFVRDSWQFGDALLGDWPAWAFQAILPAGFALLTYRYGLRCVARLSGAAR